MSVSQVVPDAREVFTDANISAFGNLVERRTQIKADIKAMEQEAKELDNAITELLVAQNCQKCKHGDKTVQLCQGSRSSLSKEKLLEAGVAATIIRDCTVTSSYTYLMVK